MVLGIEGESDGFIRISRNDATGVLKPFSPVNRWFDLNLLQLKATEVALQLNEVGVGSFG